MPARNPRFLRRFASDFACCIVACLLLHEMGMRSDGSGSPWNSVDDVWRTMSDPTPPRLSDFSTQAESSLNLARVNRAGAKAASLGVRESIATIATLPTGEHPKIADPSETRLWRIAGALMVLAVGVLGVLGWLTFTPGAASAAASIVHPAEPARAPDPSRPHAAPLATAAAPSEAPGTTASKQRPNKHHGKQKAHKRGRQAKRR
jgi:hypothetical protein